MTEKTAVTISTSGKSLGVTGASREVLRLAEAFLTEQWGGPCLSEAGVCDLSHGYYDGLPEHVARDLRDHLAARGIDAVVVAAEVAR